MIRRTAKTARRTFGPLVLCLALASVVAPAAAFAAGNSPSQDQYVPIIHQHVGGSGSSGGSGSGGAGGSGSTSSGGSSGGLSGRVGPLPFTGFDVLSMAAVALAVTGLGLGLQRAVSRRPHEDIGDSARL